MTLSGVSAIVPAADRSTIAAAVASTVDQTHMPFEPVVIECTEGRRPPSLHSISGAVRMLFACCSSRMVRIRFVFSLKGEGAPGRASLRSIDASGRFSATILSVDVINNMGKDA